MPKPPGHVELLTEVFPPWCGWVLSAAGAVGLPALAILRPELVGWLTAGAVAVACGIAMYRMLLAERRAAAKELYSVNPSARFYRAHYRLCRLYMDGEGYENGVLHHWQEFDRKVVEEIERCFGPGASHVYRGASGRVGLVKIETKDQFVKSRAELRSLLRRDFEYWPPKDFIE